MKRVEQHLWLVLGGIFLLLCVGFVIATYRFRWSSTGFLNKSLWDWLQLLIVPLALAIIALFFQRTNSRTERQIAKQRYEQDQQIALDKQREDLLQAYLDRMSELLLKEKLCSSEGDAEVRKVARVRTISVLTQLDARRISYVFSFLREARLMSITLEDNVVSLRGADLHAVNWSQANLSEANLSETDLSRANLSEADLSESSLIEALLREADLSEAFMSGADLRGAGLDGANFSGANLTDANLSGAFLKGANFGGATLIGAKFSRSNVTEEQLKKAKSLDGVTMPDGSKLPLFGYPVT